MKKRYILLLLILIFAVLILRNLLIPTLELNDTGLIYNGHKYIIMQDVEWEIMETDRQVGKIVSNNGFISDYVFIHKVYSAKYDEEEVCLWRKAFLSEFGGYRYYRADFTFPDIASITPSELIIGKYQSFNEINSFVYAYTSKKEILDIFLEILVQGKQFDYNYTKNDIAEMNEVYNEMPYFSILTDQVPFCALSLYITKENGKYYIYGENGNKYDITYVYYMIIKEGETN